MGVDITYQHFSMFVWKFSKNRTGITLKENDPFRLYRNISFKNYLKK